MKELYKGIHIDYVDYWGNRLSTFLHPPRWTCSHVIRGLCRTIKRVATCGYRTSVKKYGSFLQDQSQRQVLVPFLHPNLCTNPNKKLISSTPSRRRPYTIQSPINSARYDLWSILTGMRSSQQSIPFTRISEAWYCSKTVTRILQSRKKYPEHSFHKNFQKLVGTQLKK